MDVETLSVLSPMSVDPIDDCVALVRIDGEVASWFILVVESVDTVVRSVVVKIYGLDDVRSFEIVASVDVDVSSDTDGLFIVVRVAVDSPCIYAVEACVDCTNGVEADSAK